MEQKDDEPPPFWLQSTTTLHQVDRHRRRQYHASSLFFNTGVLVIVLMVTAVVFLVFVIPSVLSVARQVFNPSLVKSSWSSLNIILVLFAIVCGFLGRKSDDQTPVSSPMKRSGVDNPAQQSPRQWYGYQERMPYNSFGNVDTITRLRRSSSSYPDLRQDSAWLVKDNRWRSYDDTHVENHHLLQRPFQRSESFVSHERSPRVVDEHQGDAKNIEVDTFVTKTQEVSPASSPSPAPSVVDEDESAPPSPPAAPEIIHYRSEQVVVDDKCNTKSIEVDTPTSDQQKVEEILSPTQTPKSVPISPPAYIPPPSPLYYNILPPPSPTSYLWPPPSPPPPPPPPPPKRRPHPSIPTKKKTAQTFEMIGEGIYRWNNNSTKREPKQKAQPPTPPPLPPSPPPPLPRSRATLGQYSDHKLETNDRKIGGATKDFFSSFYHQSKRKRKHKRRSFENLEEVIQAPKSSIYRSKSTPEFPPPSPPPPPPPPPPAHQHSMFHNLFTKKGKSKKKVHSVPPTTPPPPPPLPKRKVSKTVSFSETPMIHVPIPPPPPPPPFKMKPYHYVMHGDYVKIESNNNSPRSGYSASEDEGSSPSTQKSSPTPPLFCPSPDVDTKADDFIAKFRAKLKLEKLDSINLKQGTGPSRLGPHDSRQ